MSLRVPCIGLGAGATVDPTRGKRGEAPSHTPGLGYPTPSHVHAHKYTMSIHNPDQGHWGLHKAVSGVCALDRKQFWHAIAQPALPYPALPCTAHSAMSHFPSLLQAPWGTMMALGRAQGTT